jgi:hypothetical protein
MIDKSGERMGGATAHDVDEIHRIIAPWMGMASWNAWLGHGSFLVLDFGAKLENGTYRDGTPVIRGEWLLWIYCSAWRIETAAEVLGASEDQRDRMSEAVKALEGRAVEEVEIMTPSLETVFRFAGGYKLRSFPIHSGADPEDFDHWMLFTPGGMVLAVGPGSTWSYKSSSKP